MVVILLSLAAALAFAVAAVLQQHAAAGQPIEQNMRVSLVISLAQRPLWLAGIGASAVGTLLQLLALWRGSLVTVQPLLVCGLLFALPINAIWMHRRRPGRRELVAAAVVCGGLALFLVATDPQSGHGSASPTAWVIALSGLLAVTAVLVGCSFASKGAARSFLLAGAAGLINGLSAAFTKGVARDLAHHWREGLGSAVAHVVTGWQLYAFGITLLLVVLLVQSAFQSGPIRWSLPALTAFNPVTSVILGATVLGEHVRSSPLALTGAAAGLALVVVGILALSSSSLITGGREAPVVAAASLATTGQLAAGALAATASLGPVEPLVATEVLGHLETGQLEPSPLEAGMRASDQGPLPPH